MANYPARTQQQKCIFCEIAQGRIKPLGGGLFYEDAQYMAWLSPFPNTEGFSVVIPKKHYESDVLHMPDADLADFVLAAKKVAGMLESALPDVGRVGLLMEGMGIDHAHIKLAPMHGTDYLKRGEWKQVHSNNNQFFQKYEGYISSHDSARIPDEKLQALVAQIKSASK